MRTALSDQGKCEDKGELQRYVLRQVCNLKMWRKGKDVAPHKPVLLLYALTRCQLGFSRMIEFDDVERALVPLLKTVQRNKSVVEPRYPFWRLQTDGLWVVEADAPMRKRRGNCDPLRSELTAKHAKGGFPIEIYDVLRSDAELLSRVMRLVFERYFSDDEQAEIKRLLAVD